MFVRYVEDSDLRPTVLMTTMTMMNYADDDDDIDDDDIDDDADERHVNQFTQLLLGKVHEASCIIDHTSTDGRVNSHCLLIR